MKLFDRIFDFVVFAIIGLVITNLSRFIALGLGISYTIFTVLLMGILLTYILFNFQVYLKAIKKTTIFSWLMVFLILPIVLTIISLALGFSSSYKITTFLGFYIFNFFLFSGAVIYASKRNIYLLVRLCILVVFIGFLLSFFFPELFNAIYILHNPEIAKWKDWVHNTNRAFGFHLQPNQSAMVLLLLFNLLFFLKTKKLRTTVLLIGLLVFGILLTGSRSSLLVAIIYSSIIYLILSLQYLKKLRLKLEASMLVASFNTMILVIGFFCALLFLPAVSQGTPIEAPLERVNSFIWGMLSFDEAKTEEIGKDYSLYERRKAQEDYIRMIGNNPIVGYGMNSNEYLRRIGEVYKASHNVYIENTLKFGLTYICFYVFTLLITFFSRYNWRKKWALRGLVIIIFFIGFSVGTILSSPFFITILGLSLAAEYE